MIGWNERLISACSIYICIGGGLKTCVQVRLKMGGDWMENMCIYIWRTCAFLYGWKTGGGLKTCAFIYGW